MIAIKDLPWLIFIYLYRFYFANIRELPVIFTDIILQINQSNLISSNYSLHILYINFRLKSNMDFNKKILNLVYFTTKRTYLINMVFLYQIFAN